jgi:hypothetical protein
MSKINLYNPYEDAEDIVKIDISYEKNDALMFRLDELSVLTVTDKNILLDLNNNENIKIKFDELDKYIVNLIQDRKITKKLKTKFNYRPLTSNYNNKDCNYDILNLNLNFEDESDYITEVYINKNKKINKNDMLELLKNNGKVQLIFEVKSIIFDKKSSMIYLDNIIRLMKAKKLKPKRIEKLKYMFNDSDNSDDSDNKSINNKTNDDCIINNNKSDTESNTESDIESDIESDKNKDNNPYMDDDKSYEINMRDDDTSIDETLIDD